MSKYSSFSPYFPAKTTTNIQTRKNINMASVIVRSAPTFDSTALLGRGALIECCRRYISKKAPPKESRRKILRKDQTDKHLEMIEVDRSDKHRYHRWGFKPLPTQTVLGIINTAPFSLLCTNCLICDVFVAIFGAYSKLLKVRVSR